MYGMNCWEFPLHVVSGHLIADLPGDRALVDFGSPITLGRSGASDMLGSVHTGLASSEVLDAVRRHAGIEVDLLVGCDVLAEYVVLVDLVRHRLVLYAESIRPASAHAIEIVHGLPVVAIEHQGRMHRAFLDSGAQIGYAPAWALEGTSVSRISDFYPLLGEYETDCGTVEVRLLGRTLNMNVGILPDMLAVVAGATDGWIAGSEVFLNRSILVSLKGNWVADVTDMEMETT